MAVRIKAPAQRFEEEDLAGMLRRVGDELIRGQSRLDVRLDRLETDVAGLKTDVNDLKTDVSDLKTDVAGLKTDVNDLKTDVSDLKTDVSDLKTDVGDLKSGLAETNARLDRAELAAERRHDLVNVRFDELAGLIIRDERKGRWPSARGDSGAGVLGAT